MTRSKSGKISLVPSPCLELEALRHLRSLISLKLVSLSNLEKSTTEREHDNKAELSATPQSTTLRVGKYPIPHKTTRIDRFVGMNAY